MQLAGQKNKLQILVIKDFTARKQMKPPVLKKSILVEIDVTEAKLVNPDFENIEEYSFNLKEIIDEKE